MRVAVSLLLLAAAALAAGPGQPVRYVGGTLAGLDETDGWIDLTGEENLLFRTKNTQFEVPYQSVNLLEYGQKVDRRYVAAIIVSPLLLLSKKRQHFLTLGYTDAVGRQQAMVLKVKKGHIRAALVSLEAKTGRKVQYQDEEARKSGKG